MYGDFYFKQLNLTHIEIKNKTYNKSKILLIYSSMLLLNFRTFNLLV